MTKVHTPRMSANFHGDRPSHFSVMCGSTNQQTNKQTKKTVKQISHHTMYTPYGG